MLDQPPAQKPVQAKHQGVRELFHLFKNVECATRWILGQNPVGWTYCVRIDAKQWVSPFFDYDLALTDNDDTAPTAEQACEAIRVCWSRWVQHRYPTAVEGQRQFLRQYWGESNDTRAGKV